MARILVVDDDPDFVEVVRLVLEAKGYQVEVAYNGETALEMMRENPPDLVILDVMMKGVLDGVYLAHTMDEELPKIPVIMVSSITSSPLSELFPTDEYIPIDAWISKPVQAEDLVRKVEELVGKPVS